MFEALYFYMLKRGLSFAQVVVVTSLARNGEMTETELAREIGASRPSVSGTLYGMREEGLVERHRALHDKRKAFWSLTEAGWKVAEELEKVKNGVIERYEMEV